MFQVECCVLAGKGRFPYGQIIPNSMTRPWPPWVEIVREGTKPMHLEAVSDSPVAPLSEAFIHIRIDRDIQNS